MNLTDKYSALCTKYLDFINGLSQEFSSIKKSSRQFDANQSADIKESFHQLQEFYGQTLETIGKKEN